MRGTGQQVTGSELSSRRTGVYMSCCSHHEHEEEQLQAWKLQQRRGVAAKQRQKGMSTTCTTTVTPTSTAAQKAMRAALHTGSCVFAEMRGVCAKSDKTCSEGPSQHARLSTSHSIRPACTACRLSAGPKRLLVTTKCTHVRCCTAASASALGQEHAGGGALEDVEQVAHGVDGVGADVLRRLAVGDAGGAAGCGRQEQASSGAACGA